MNYTNDSLFYQDTSIGNQVVLRWYHECLTNTGRFGNTVAVLDLRPFYAALLNSQLLAKSKVFKDYVTCATEYEPEKFMD